jgi:SOS-response transcriptional repressor LexA
METIADRIRRARTAAKLTQPQLADLAGVSKGTVSMWENGITKPNGENLVNLAKALNLRPEILSEDEGNVSPLNIQTTKVPLISWVAAGHWCESPDNFSPGDAEDWLDSPYPHSKLAFCLELVGQSMVPEYREGEVILVDPEIQGEHGDDVVVRTPNNTHTFKRLQITPDGTYLLALNPEWPAAERIIKMPEGTHICGVVTASWIRRRKRKK